jgi:KipI family sensor histidine kinase inhibitor
METGLFEKARYRTAGDRGLLVEYGNAIHPDVHRKVRSIAILLQQEMPPGIVEILPTYRSILMVYDPCKVSPMELKGALANMEARLSDIRIPEPKLVEIPVCYGGAFGPDIDFVAEAHRLRIEDVVQIHSRPEYLIYMVGFTPGFPFLGGLPDVLHTPRLDTPRTRVPEGSVGIANNQTGVYPVASPGGWRIIGRTPLTLFRPLDPNPFRYQAGDRLRFRPISEKEYHRIRQEETA